jgi:protein-S-isoprenylcysteine O-methyltransferase Ste14
MTLPPPSTRKVAAAGLIVLLILLWALVVAIFAPFVSRWPVLVQAPFYLFVGIAWIIPLKPLLRWSETGSWKAIPKGDAHASNGDASGRQG